MIFQMQYSTKKNIKRETSRDCKKYEDEYTIDVRGRGLAYGFEVKEDKSIASEISEYAFKENLICVNLR